MSKLDCALEVLPLLAACGAPEPAFEIVQPELCSAPGAQPNAWSDYDNGGDLDLFVANYGPDALWRNEGNGTLARRSVRVMVLDSAGVYTIPGAEVRVYAAGTGRLLGTRLVDTDGGYCSQNVMPVHVGLPRGMNRVTVEVTVLGHDGRTVTTIEGVDPNILPRRILTVRASH